jgi:hypothetical protein
VGETDDFEWDDVKDARTRTNRDLELLAASRLFDGRRRLERVSPKSEHEVRYETMAEVEGRVLFRFWTWRGPRRRIISLRLAHRSERRAYEKATRNG